MKKATFLACACALFMGQSLMAQETVQVQEVIFVEDATQGVLDNKFKDNWFLGVEGGIDMINNRQNNPVARKKRFAPDAELFFGKWFSPKFGVRANLEWFQSKATYKMNYFGLSFDAMLNLTNWWCGYNPTRVYNASIYAGAGIYGRYAKDRAGDWEYTHSPLIVGRLGLLNTFRLSDHWQFLIDLRVTGTDKSMIQLANMNEGIGFAALAGFTYNFGKSNWSAPVVPVCPPAENCDALRARLAAAEARVSDLERQLQDCLNRKPEVVTVSEPEALATIYFPIGVSRLTREDKNIVNAVADVLKADTSKKYDVKGYADTYTGTDAINNRLRQQRAENVVKQLVSRGVSAGQVTAVPVQGNLHGDNEALVSLDRCAVIVEK